MEEVRQSTGEASVFRWGCLLCLQPLPPHFLADSNLSSTLQPFFQETLQLPSPSASQGAGPHLHHSLPEGRGGAEPHHLHHPPYPWGWKCALVCPLSGLCVSLKGSELDFSALHCAPNMHAICAYGARKEGRV